MEKISSDNFRQSITSESTMLAHTTFDVKTINQQLGEMYEEVMREIMTTEERWTLFESLYLNVKIKQAKKRDTGIRNPYQLPRYSSLYKQ